MKKSGLAGMQYVELVPGSNHYVMPEPEDPNEANRNSEVRVYRLNPDGTKGEFLRTESAYPPGWDDHKILKQMPNLNNQRGEEIMVKYNWEELWPQVLELQAQGKSAKEIAAELEIDLPVLKSKIYREERQSKKQQTPTPAPVQAANQEPVQEKEGPAENIIPEPDNEQVKGLKQGGFTIADEEPLLRAGSKILAVVWEKIEEVVKDPIALPLLKELIRQGEA